MSKIGKKPIEIPQGVKIKTEGDKVVVSGSKGELLMNIRPEIDIEIKEEKVYLSPKLNTKKTKAFWGLERARLYNMIKGVNEGFEKKLEIEGLGFKANLEGKTLVLEGGFTHPVRIEPEDEVNFSVQKNIISVFGIDKEKVGRVASKIRKIWPPDPYKGKGIRYLGEVIKLKPGKKTAMVK